MRIKYALTLAIAIAGCANPPKTITANPFSPAPQSDATWPWTDAALTNPRKGFERWQKISSDGTKLDLFAFDFSANPNLEFGLYDQDQHDDVPGDNGADYFPKSVIGVARELEAEGNGRVLAAWNGLFFAYDRSANPPNGLAKHIGPVVIAGKPMHNVGRNRWMFGIANSGEFETRFKPEFETLNQFRYAADGAQCLIREGKPLQIEPYPPVPIEPGTKLSRNEPTSSDAGHIPIVDHIRTSRTSMAWSKDSKRLYVLIVIEPDTETESTRRLRQGIDLGSGWNLFDLQRFWLSMGVWGAVNSDGGNVAQFLATRSDGKFDFQPSQTSGKSARKIVSNASESDPGGGSLLSFWVRERTAQGSSPSK